MPTGVSFTSEIMSYFVLHVVLRFSSDPVPEQNMSQYPKYLGLGVNEATLKCTLIADP